MHSSSSPDSRSQRARCVLCMNTRRHDHGKIKSDKMTNGSHVDARGNIVLIVFKITIIFGGLGSGSWRRGAGWRGEGGGGGVLKVRLGP